MVMEQYYETVYYHEGHQQQSAMGHYWNDQENTCSKEEWFNNGNYQRVVVCWLVEEWTS